MYIIVLNLSMIKLILELVEYILVGTFKWMVVKRQWVTIGVKRPGELGHIVL